MATCSFDTCNLEAIHDKNECALHCEKSSFNIDSQGIQLTRLFKNSLCVYLTKDLGAEFECRIKRPRSVLEQHLSTGKDDGNNRYSTFLKDQEITIQGVNFPDRRNQDRNDYLQILNRFKGIHFRDCIFNTSDVSLRGKNIFFDTCRFKSTYSVKNSVILPNNAGTLYSECIFEKDVTTFYAEKGEIETPLFSDCEFEGVLNLAQTHFTTPVFLDTPETYSKIEGLNIKGCEFDDKFIVNYKTFNSISIEDSTFNEKVEMKYNSTELFYLINSNFSKLVDMYQSRFTFFNSRKCIFEKIATFEECEFGCLSEEDNESGQEAIFNHVTFLDFTNFRDARFFYGLDLRNTNLKESPNFLDVYVDFRNSNRETFRIIKQSFDKIGNHIEANKYFSEEMKKYKEEVSENGSKRERFILWVNEKSSDFGQDYLLPIKWMILASVVYYFLAIAKEKNWLYKTFPCCGNFLNDVSTYLNGWAGHVLPFQKFLEPGMQLISLFFYVIFAGLTWQTVVAIKRHTRR